jgi:hypothetical protein
MLETLAKTDRIQDMKTPLSTRPSSDYRFLGENAGDRDNQQERLVRLARTAMLIECEGSITIGMTPPTKTRNRPALYSTVDVTNTSLKIIGEYKDTLGLIGVGFTSRPQRYGKGFGRKLRSDVNVHGFWNVETLLRTIMPFLDAKKRQAKILLEFIASRQSSPRKSEYSESEWQLVTDVRLLNGRMPNRKALAKAVAFLESPESIRQPRAVNYYKRYVKMCADLQRNLENPAEMPGSLPN